MIQSKINQACGPLKYDDKLWRPMNLNLTNETKRNNFKQTSETKHQVVQIEIVNMSIYVLTTTWLINLFRLVPGILQEKKKKKKSLTRQEYSLRLHVFS